MVKELKFPYKSTIFATAMILWASYHVINRQSQKAEERILQQQDQCWYEQAKELVKQDLDSNNDGTTTLTEWTPFYNQASFDPTNPPSISELEKYLARTYDVEILRNGSGCY